MPIPEYLKQEIHAFFTHAGHRLYYRVVGTGPPLVLIHGFGVSGYIWQWTLPYLAQQHTVFLVDLPGHGQSTYTPPWRLREMAPLLAAWLHSLQLSEVAVMGQSTGGAIAIHLAATEPELVSRLILVSAAGIPLQATFSSLARRSVHSFFQWGNGTYPPGLLRDVLRPRLRLFWQVAHEVERSDFQQELAQITQPTLIIWGERDALLPISLGHALHKALPHSQFVTFPGCGHRPMLAEPAALSKLVLDFLKRA